MRQSKPALVYALPASVEYLDLIDHVEGICISLVRENDLYQGISNAISAVGCSFKSVVEVCCGILDRSTTPEDYKTRNADTFILGFNICFSEIE